MNIFTNKIKSLANLIFVVLLCFIVVNSLKYLSDFLKTDYLVPLLISFIFVIMFFIFVIIGIKKNSHLCFVNLISNSSVWKLALIIFLVSLFTKVLFIIILNYDCTDYNGDMGTYINLSDMIARNGRIISNDKLILEFPHLFWYAIFLLPVTMFFGISHTAISVYLAIIISISMVFLFLTLLYIKLNKVAVFFTFLLLVLNPSQMLLPQLIIHEIAFMFFLSLSILLYFRIIPDLKSQKAKIFTYLIFSLDLCCMVKVNSVGYIVIIAYIILIIFEKSICNGKYALINKIISVVCLLLVLASSSFVFNNILYNLSFSKSQNISNSVYWTLYVGSSVENNACWNAEDQFVLYDYPEDYTKEQINEYQLNLVKNRYSELWNNKPSILKLLTTKFYSIWKSYDFPINFAKTAFTDENSNLSNSGYVLFFNFLMAFQLLVHIIITLGYLFTNIKNRTKMKNTPDAMTFIQLTIIGTTILLMLSEISNKYITGIFPIFFIICTYYTILNFKKLKPATKK